MTDHAQVPTIPLPQLEVGARFRVKYEDIDKLAHSIKTRGLISPLAVGVAEKMAIPRETDCPYILLAGGRRLQALIDLGWTDIPVRIYDQVLSELDYRSIELAENFDRKDMAYAEEVALMRQIDALQRQIHGPKHSKAPDAPGWGQSDTAKLTKKSAATVTRDIQLAEAIEKFPELQLDKCKNKAEAMKRLKSVGKVLTTSAAAAEYTKKVGVSDKAFQKLSSAYIVGDCFDTFKQIPDNTLSFIEIDPPYGIDLHNVKKDNECIGYNEVDASEYVAFMKKVLSESYRTLREGSWLVCWFAADPWFAMISDYMREAGFKMNLIPGIWAKPQGQTAQPETFLGNSYEMFFYARKGQAKLNKPGRSNVFSFSPVAHTKKYHPTQRPLDLMTELYSTFARPGDMGYIPFAGSGVGLLAGHHCSMNMFATDLTKEFKDGYIMQLKEILGTNGSV